ncbi:zincin [Rhizoclosmatium globosum]|uniref:Zincin n=1 Tax=Rhizoclosmatium globosum TaxID=329046 RepID=A0A1Y2CBN2_9FUNG|nr:zincin [Rhizoclosmatium globosum]|eukprot:ORY44461.1 zincin [Rhizoclosmatium globosum]
MSNPFEIGDDEDIANQPKPTLSQATPISLPVQESDVQSPPPPIEFHRDTPTANNVASNAFHQDNEAFDQVHTDTDRLISSNTENVRLLRKASTSSLDSNSSRRVKKSVTISTARPKIIDLESNNDPSSPVTAHQEPTCCSTRNILLAIWASNNVQQTWTQLCTTRDCVSSATSLFTGMDETVNPCTDFYAFACSNWIQNNPIPDFSLGVSVFSKMITKNTKLLKTIVEAPYQVDASLSSDDDVALDKASFGNMQEVYWSCMNRTQIQARGVQPLTDYVTLFSKTYFPLTSSTNPNKTDSVKLATALAAAHDVGVFPLFASYVDVDLKNPDKYVLGIIQSGISFPSEEYNDTMSLRFLAWEIQQAFTQVLGNPLTNSTLKGLVKLEKQLAANFYPDDVLFEENPEITYNPKPLKSVSLTTVDMQKYFQLRIKFYNKLDKNTIADLTTINYFNSIDKVISTTTPSVLEAYLLWQQIRMYMQFIETNHIMNPHPNGEKTATLKKVVPKFQLKPFDNYLSQMCMYGVDAILGDILSKAFVKKTFPETSKKAAQDLVTNIKAAFSDKIQTLSWLDAPTRTLALNKVASIVAKIGYDDSIMNPRLVAEKYPFTMSRGEFFENVMKGERNLIRLNLNKLASPVVDRTEWFMTPATVNAYYNPVWNEIVFPAGVLLDPMYNANRPEYINYGVIGMIIGHEIVHAFDNQGRLYDATGKLNDWWSKQSEDAFNTKAQCIVKQYSNYSVTDVDGTKYFIDGQLSNGENIADNGGLSIALKSWKTASNLDEGKNMMLPGLGNYTHEQLYFLSYGQLWCTNQDPSVDVMLLSDPHSPARYRVNGPLKNSVEFAKAFKCPANSPMNPTNKCLLW